MPNKGKFIGSQDNLFVPDAPTIGTATADGFSVSIAFTAPSDVGADAITLYGASLFLAGATINYKVSVGTGTLSTGGSGNVYFIDGIPTKQLSLIKGFTYVFDLSDSSNSGHPFAFKDGSGNSYTSGVTTSGTAGNASATVTLVLATDASEPSSYYCTSHGNGMGNTISLIAPSASTDPLGAAQLAETGSSSPITIAGLTADTSYIAKVWAINDYGNGPLSSASNSFAPVTSIALHMGGTSGGAINVVQKFVPETAGNSTDFGDLSSVRYYVASFSSDTRSVIMGGYVDDLVNTIEYFTFSSAGNATDFGDTTDILGFGGGFSNNTRGIVNAGLYNAATNKSNVLEYVTIASTGNGTDFGDSTVTVTYDHIGFASSTRGISGGGFYQNGGVSDHLDYVTIASTGNATDFGNMTEAKYVAAGSSNNTRGIISGGYLSNARNTIEYITIASTGNGTDFGDLLAGAYGPAACANPTKGFTLGGHTGSEQNVIQQVTIATTGDATDFGDLLQALKYGTANCSGTEAVQS